MNPDRLRDIPILASLGEEEFVRIARRGRELRLAPGDVLFRQGDHATAFHILLEGRLETSREVAGERALLVAHGPGGYLGALALLTDTPYRGGTVAVADSVVFELEGDELRRLASIHPSMMRAFLPAIESVSGAVKGLDRDREKLVAVGQLAAGLAHELNNPAAAASRGVSTLREFEARRQAAFAQIAAAGASAESLAMLAGLGVRSTDGAVEVERLDPIERSDREDVLAGRLAARGVTDGYDIAAAMTDAGLGDEWVERVIEAVGEGCLEPGLRFVASCAGTRVLLAEVEEATRRISDLVEAVRAYSYLDQAPTQEVDIHAGLENTITLLAHGLREKRIDIVRDLDPELPLVHAAGSELNQVWTNLIDNAIDAVAEGGRITVRTRRQGERVMVEIGDDGPGIPEGIRARIFDAFFTTKAVGDGTGLGLDIVRRIITRHHGEVRLESEPGDTRFQVLLPLGG